MNLRSTTLLIGTCTLTVAVACGASDDAASSSTPPPASTSSSTSSSSSSSSGDVPDASAEGGQPPMDMSPEALAFFERFHASRYSQVGTSITSLEEAVKGGRTQGQNALVRALAHLWHVSESGRDPKADGASLQAEAMALADQFAFAQQKQPDDPRVGCFLGTTLIGAGQATKNEALTAQGTAILDAAVKAYPEFNLFCRALAYDGFPATDPMFTKAVDAMWETVDVCFGEKVDRENPDIGKYLGQATSEGQKRVCWNDWIAPHNAEGFYLYFGDLLVKQGKVASAKVMFANVKKIREYPSWPYKALVDERLGSDLDAKAALYKDPDKRKHPSFGGASMDRSCTYCHAASAGE